MTGCADSYLALFNNPELNPLTSEFKVTMITAPERIVTKLNSEKFTSWMDMYSDDWYKHYYSKPLNELFNLEEA